MQGLGLYGEKENTTLQERLYLITHGNSNKGNKQTRKCVTIINTNLTKITAGSPQMKQIYLVKGLVEGI